MKSAYKILMSVELEHEYYASGKCPDIRLVPSESTRALLANSSLLWKMEGHQLLVIVKVNDDQTPFKPLPLDQKLVFYLDLLTSDFMTISSFELSRFRTHRFYFSNRAENLYQNKAYLSSPLASYEGAKTYLPGDMVTGPSDEAYECKKESTGNAPTDPTFWVQKGAFRYSTTQDLIRVIFGSALFKLSSARQIFTIKVYGYNTLSSDFDQLVLDEHVIDLGSGESSDEVQVSLSGLGEGKYRVEISGESFMVYASTTMINTTKLGVLEIFFSEPNGSDYGLLDINGKVQELSTTIRFANRRAYWTYHTPKLNVENIKVSGSNPAVHPFTAYSSDPVNAPSRKDYFVSNEPLLLTEQENQNNFQLELADTSNTDLPKASKPEPFRSGILTKQNSDYYVHIHLNY